MSKRKAKPDPPPRAVIAAHVAPDGVVWAAADGCDPLPTGRTTGDFLTELRADRATQFRLAGTPGNAGLLLGLDRRRLAGQCGPVLVRGPKGVCGANDPGRKDPVSALLALRPAGPPPSCGGYHDFDDDDRATYALAEWAAAGAAGTIPREAVGHPALVAARFVPHLDVRRLAALVGVIVDPRWHLCVLDPDRSTLETFLGLAPQVRPDRSASPAARRAELVRAAWKTAATPPPEARRGDPGYFVWRRWLAADRDGRTADLRAGQHFVDYLRLTWLDRLARRRRPGAFDGIFDPDRFFGAAEAAAYRAAAGRA